MIYIDGEYKCYTEQNSDGTLREIEDELFTGMCKAYIEGCIYVPKGESLMLPDGSVFRGEMITKWKPYDQLATAQAQYEAELAEAAAAYQEGVNSAYDN